MDTGPWRYEFREIGYVSEREIRARAVAAQSAALAAMTRSAAQAVRRRLGEALGRLSAWRREEVRRRGSVHPGGRPLSAG